MFSLYSVAGAGAQKGADTNLDGNNSKDNGNKRNGQLVGYQIRFDSSTVGPDTRYVHGHRVCDSVCADVLYGALFLTAVATSLDGHHAYIILWFIVHRQLCYQYLNTFGTFCNGCSILITMHTESSS